MKSKLNIFFVSSEVFPFTQAGALGEVAGALPKYIKNFGHDIRVMTPNYKSINERKYVLRDVIRLQGLKIPVGDDIHIANAKSAFLPDSKVQIYFLDNKHFFQRDGLYADPRSGKEYKDNDERFIFFCKGCLETLKLLYWQPDIIHCSGWQTALIPILLKTIYRQEAFFKNTRTLLSFPAQFSPGHFTSSTFEKAGIQQNHSGAQNNNGLDFLKVGLEYADLLSTYGESAVASISELAQNRVEFKDILARRKNDIYGIVNGIDSQIWNPEKDSLIPFQYSRRDPSGKAKNKVELLNRYSLEFSEKIPVISLIAHATNGNLQERLLAVIDQLVSLDLYLLIFGSIDPKYQKRVKAIQKQYPKKVRIEPLLNTALTHLIVAGSDLFLMPSAYDVFGLDQLYCLAYGTIPLISNTMGAAEAIVTVNPETATGTGFIFNHKELSEILKVVKQAIKSYQRKEVWAKIIQNAMRVDVSWDVSAQKYVKLYNKLMSLRNSR
jgi:starch synthase